MSFGGSLQIGRSGLLTAQTALDTVGHNLSNVATRGYHRQTVSLSPAGSQNVRGADVGRGVQLDAITRQVNEALHGRLRGAIADEAGAGQRQELLRQLETIENEFSDSDLTSRLGRFFDAWSELANNPQDDSLRSLVVREAQTLAGFLGQMRTQMVALGRQADDAAASAGRRVNELLDAITELNDKIGVQEASGRTAAALRDQRDATLGELAEFLDISTVTQSNGKVDVYVGSEPIVLNGKSRGVELIRQDTIGDGEPTHQLVTSDNKTTLNVSTGKLGELVRFGRNDLAEAIATLDTFAHEMIRQVNRQHSQGQGLVLHERVTGDYRAADPTAALNAPGAGLAFAPDHGSFRLHVTQGATGQRSTATINVNLDGIDPASQTSLEALAAQIDAVSHVSASVTNDGRLAIAADDGHQIGFSDDTSGALAALGVNTFFTGSDARDIGVSPRVAQSPSLLAVAQNHDPGDNTNARAIEQLRGAPVDELGGISLAGYWNRHVEAYGARLAEAREQVSATQSVRENLEHQQQAVSGVNVDEEAVDLIRYQRAYQASARFLSVVDEMMRTLLQSV